MSHFKMDSLKKRYFYKLLANSVGFIFSFVTAGVVPRGLGPKAYGDFSFLTNFFAQITGFFDMGSSVCFYNKLSQRTKDFGLVSFYLYFMGATSLAIMAFVAFLHLTSRYIYFWPNQGIQYIYLAAGYGILAWGINIFNKMMDAYGLTVPGEKAKFLQKIVGLILIILLYSYNKLSLKAYFYYQYIILFFLTVMFIWAMEYHGYSVKNGWNLTLSKIKGYFKEFYHYSHPLFTSAVIGLIVGVVDRWILQIYGGSIQQGFFGFSYQIGTLCFFSTGAMTPLLMREFSISFSNNDFRQMTMLFRRYIPMLFSITAFISCFVATQADKVIYIIGGNKYKEALIPVIIMAFCPIHQTYGQLSSSVILASGQTRLHRNIDVFFMLIGLPLTYFLVAPRDYWGMNAGATGLAIKTVLLQFVWVNLYLFFNTRLLKMNFLKYLGHQVLSISSVLAIGICVRFGIDKVLASHSVIFKFILAGILYTALVLLMVYCIPLIFGLNKKDIKSVIKSIFNKMNIKQRRVNG